jgi:hypothetical protein
MVFDMKSPGDRVLLPKAKKFTCSSFDDLQHVTLPSLQHLHLSSICPLEGSDIKLSRASQVTLNKVKILELSIWVLCRQFQLPGFAKHFTNVTRIIVNPFNPDFDSYTPVESDFWHQLEAGEPFFPKIQTIDLAIGKCTRNFAEMMLQIIKPVILIRKRIGWPIKTLRFDIPHPPDMDWFRANVESVGFFNFEDEFAWDRQRF